MKATVIGVMKSHMDNDNLSVCNENMPQLLENMKTFAGAEAGICYMSKPYFGSYVSDPIKANKRFGTVVPTGHHSIAGHGQVALLLEDIPKIIAMYLNNLITYETSEKSGRYTVMTGNTPEEITVYEKWCAKFQDKIFETYGDKIDDRTRDKLAKENARYLLSIFTPTTMGYTASIRQLNYIIDWAERFTKLETPNNYFYNNLKKCFAELAESLKPIVYVEELRDHKNRMGFDMIEFVETNTTEFQFGKVYNIGYKGSFAEYAQLQRHRSLAYDMQFDGIAKEFYIPEIIKEDTSLVNEWLEDMKSVAQYVPTGTLVYIEECGEIENFFLKSMERNCGRAQLEIMIQNLETQKLFYDNIDKFPAKYQEIIKKFALPDGEGKMKCQVLNCKEPCVWGPLSGRLRKI